MFLRWLSVALILASTNAAAVTPSTTTPHSSLPASASRSVVANDRGTVQLPLVVSVKAMPEPTQQEREYRDAERREKSDSDWWLVKLTGALAIATVALAIVTAFLWAATRRLVIDAKDTSKMQLRAYVSVDTEHMVDSSGNTIPNRHGFLIKNHGNTPAHDLEHWTLIGVSDFPLKHKLEAPDENRLIVKTVVHPGNDRLVITDLALLSEEMTAIEAGTHAWYAWGCARYFDVFGEPHSTNFCFFVDKDALALQRWAHYKDGNEAT
jgi:hypothetical protein